MRDTEKYPVTKLEKLHLLHELYDKWYAEYSHNSVTGDMTGVILKEIMEDVKKVHELFL